MGTEDGTATFAVASPAQAGLWLLGELAPGTPEPALCRAYRVRGPLDRAALREAWQTVVRRHESLRTTIVDRAGRPVLRVARDVEDDAWLFADLTAAGIIRVADPDGAADVFCARLEPDGVPAKLVLARLGPDDHLVALVVPETVCDDASLAIVVDELSAVYASTVDLPAPRPYTDYARQASAQHHQHLRDWWCAALTPPPAPPALPVDHLRAADVTGPAGTLPFDWTSLLAVPATAELGEPHVVLLAAFQALLHHYDPADRIAVGLPVSTRPEEFARSVGTFENVLVVAADLTGAPTFRELVGRVRAALADALDHRALPFAELVAALAVDRVPHRVPFCDAVFVVREPAPPLRLAGTRAVRHPDRGGRSRADLTLTVDAGGGTGALGYRTDVFEASSAELLLEQLRTLLTVAVTAPDTPVPALPLADGDRLRATVRDADRVADGPARDTAGALVRQVAERTPDAPALSAGGTHVSYAELGAGAARITGALGAVAGEPVVVRMAAGPRQVAAVLGVLDAGAHLVCLGADEMGERGRAVLADVRPARLVLDGPAEGDPLAQWYAGELSGVVVDVAALTGGGAEPVPVTPADRAYVAYTSGSTGRPKGIPQSHATLAQFVTWFSGEFRIGPGARLAQWAAPGYDAALCETFAALVAGATLCPVPDRIRAHPEKLVGWLAAERITHFQTVPSFAREVLRVVTSGGGVPADLGHLLLAGEALPGELAANLRAALPSVRLVNLYGPTELILATWHEITADGHGIVPIGRSIPGRQVLVLDQADRPCPAGVPGEIVVRSPYATAGYLGTAAGERAAFRPLADDAGPGLSGACFRTGDRGRLRLDGTLEFLGRKDFQVKFNGIRLELGDLEAALSAHDSVAECAVVAVPGAHGLVARLVAYVVPVRGTDGVAAGAAKDWRAALRARFGKAMPPVMFRTLLGLPRNLGGKVDRSRLPDPGRPGTETATEPQSWAARDMALIWSEVGVEPAGAEDGFFAAGGHSALVPRVLHLLRERTGVTVSVPEFFADPTPAGLAARVESRVDLLDGVRTQH
ncbi:non-ribosomal peptide synthetase [Amycolatopsis sp. cmx-8-4]|uniref:non-ribosomal peptide synthetase n=1 Tax=Amycolatopsis sp. cmx-8-4 TaxID=2790947 RepID=UPI00397E8617